jgi:hypothetical protein
MFLWEESQMYKMTVILLATIVLVALVELAPMVLAFADGGG